MTPKPVNEPITDKIAAKLGDLTTLTIRTTVKGADEKSIKTTIGLLDGDITTVMAEAFLTDEKFVPLREFHAAREKQGGEIIKNNIDALKSIVELASSLRG